MKAPGVSKAAKPAKRARGGALFVIAALLFGSAIIRIGMEAGPALAREAAATLSHEESQLNESPPSTEIPADLQGLLDAISKREEALKIREKQIDDRMKALEIADAAIETKMAELIEVENALSSTLAMADGASENDLARLTTVYEKMKPKDAAALFEEMEPRFAAGFLSRMRPDAAAAIMAGLSPQGAYTISVVLAGRNATVPKN